VRKVSEKTEWKSEREIWTRKAGVKTELENQARKANKKSRRIKEWNNRRIEE
jgi:hypothetical protein